MNNNKKMDIDYLKQLLYFQIGDLRKMPKQMIVLKSNIEILKEAKDLIISGDFVNQYEYLNIILLGILPDKEWQNISYQIIREANVLKRSVDRGEIINAQKKLDAIYMVLNLIMLEFDKKYEKVRMKYNTKKLKTYFKIQENLKFKIPLNEDQLKEIDNLLDEYNIIEKEKVNLMQILASRNIKYSVSLNKIEERRKWYELDDVLKAGYENITIDLLPDEDDMEFVDSQLTYFIKDTFKDMKNFEQNLKVIEVFNEEQKKYFFTSALNEINQNRISLNETIKTREAYFDEEIKDVIVNEFKGWTGLYLKVRISYDLFLEECQQNKESFEDKIEKLHQECVEPTNKLYYGYKMDTYNFYVEEVTDVPDEYLEIIYDLLEGFKYNCLGAKNIKKLTNNNELNDVYELKKGQVRILYNSLGNNNFLIIGIKVKKSTTDKSLYKSIGNRNRDFDINNDDLVKLSNEAETKLYDYIDINKKKYSK